MHRRLLLLLYHFRSHHNDQHSLSTSSIRHSASALGEIFASLRWHSPSPKGDREIIYHYREVAGHDRRHLLRRIFRLFVVRRKQNGIFERPQFSGRTKNEMGKWKKIQDRIGNIIRNSASGIAIAIVVGKSLKRTRFYLALLDEWSPLTRCHSVEWMMGFDGSIAIFEPQPPWKNAKLGENASHI